MMLAIRYRGRPNRKVPSDNGSCRLYWIFVVVVVFVLSGTLFLAGQLTAGCCSLGFSFMLAFIVAAKLIHDETVKQVAHLDEKEDAKGSTIIEVPESYSDPGLP